MIKNPTETLHQCCEHGSYLHECLQGNCPEIWRVLTAPEEQGIGTTGLTGGAEGSDKKTNGKLFQDFWADHHGGGRTTKRTGLAFDHNTVTAMLHYGAINERQAHIAHRLIDLPRRGVWEQIAGELGCCGKTVKRDYQQIESALSRKSRQIYPDGSILVRKRQGKPEYWFTHEIKFRNWADYRRELLIDRSQIRVLIKAGRRLIRWPAPKYRDSSLSRLFDALFTEFANLPKPAEWPRRELAEHWKFNTDRCRRFLLKRIGSRPWSMNQIYLALGKQSKLCRACGTPMLIGLRDINGQKVTRRKETCGNTCKIAAYRMPNRVSLSKPISRTNRVPRSRPALSRQPVTVDPNTGKPQNSPWGLGIGKSTHLKGFDSFFCFVALILEKWGPSELDAINYRAESIFKIIGNGNADEGLKLVRNYPKAKIDIYAKWRDFSQDQKDVLREEISYYLQGLPTD